MESFVDRRPRFDRWASRFDQRIGDFIDGHWGAHLVKDGDEGGIGFRNEVPDTGVDRTVPEKSLSGA